MHGSINLDRLFVDSKRGQIKIADLFGVSQTTNDENSAPKHNLLKADLLSLAEFARQLGSSIKENPEDTFNLGSDGHPP